MNQPRGPRELRAATNEFTATDLVRSWRYFVITIVMVACAMTGAVWESVLILQLGCSLLTGLLMVRLFVIYHDFQHAGNLPRSRLADWTIKFCGMFCLAPTSVWNSSHSYHHRHNSKLRTAQIGSFPIMTSTAFAEASAVDRRVYLLSRHPLTILFGYLVIFMAGMCVLPFLRDPKRHVDGLVAIVLHAVLAGLLVVFTGWQGLLLGLLIPYFIAAMVGAYLFYAQHNFPGVVHHEKSEWTYQSAALQSSSFIAMHPLMHWFTANIGYHHIHHLNPQIAFHRLPEAMDRIPELQTPRSTSLAPNEIARCLRLKLWDVEAHQMVPIR